MLPFPIISNTNVRERSTIKKLVGTNAIFLLYNNGKLFGRGGNNLGQLGTGNTVNQSEWILVQEDVRDVFSSAFGTYIIKNDGTILYTGQGYTVNNGSTNILTFTNYTSLFGTYSGTIVDIKSGSYSTLFLTSANELYGFGMNINGELGSSTLNSFRNVQFIASSVKKIELADRSSGYLTTTGKFYRTGYNSFYQLGTGSNTPVTTFTMYNVSYEVKDFLFGYYCTYLLLRDSVNNRMRLYNCGAGLSGTLGNGSTTIQKTSFSELTQFTDTAMLPTETFNIKSVITSSVMFMNVNGTGFYSTGSNNNAPFGNGSSGETKVYLTSDAIGIPPQGLLSADIIVSGTGTFILVDNQVYASSIYNLYGVNSNVFINITDTLPLY